MITRGQAAGRERVVTLKSRVLWLTLCQQLDALRFRDAVVQHFPRIAQVDLKDLPAAVHHYAVAMLILDIGIPTNAELNVVRFCRATPRGSRAVCHSTANPHRMRRAPPMRSMSTRSQRTHCRAHLRADETPS